MSVPLLCFVPLARIQTRLWQEGLECLVLVKLLYGTCVSFYRDKIDIGMMSFPTVPGRHLTLYVCIGLGNLSWLCRAAVWRWQLSDTCRMGVGNLSRLCRAAVWRWQLSDTCRMSVGNYIRPSKVSSCQTQNHQAHTNKNDRKIKSITANFSFITLLGNKMTLRKKIRYQEQQLDQSIRSS